MSRRILVTGASRGIGRATALALAEAGHEVALNYRSNEAAAGEVLEAIRAAGGSASLLPFDVADRGATHAALAADVEANGGYWGLVLNAGITADGPFASMKGEDWDRVVATNLGGFFNVVQPLVMPMVRLRDGGRIVAMSSISGLTGNRGQANYAATKAGLVAAVKSLAQELAKRGVTVNSVAPGFIDTDMVQDVPREEVLDRIPMRRFGTPEEVAGLVRFLFSEGAGYITGQVLSINGGMA